MKRLLKLIPIVLFTISFQVSYGQLNLRKANKQYELYAFNLAIQSYLKVLDRNPRNVEAMGKIADCYRHINRMDQAEKWYSKAVKQSKADEIFYFQYGQVLKSLGKYDEARQWFLRYAQKFPVQGNQYAESCNFAKARMQDAPDYEVKNEYLNTSSSDFGAAIFDGKVVVYASSRRDIKNRRSPSQTIPNNQLFLTIRDDNNYLESPQLLKRGFGQGNEGPIAYSSDGSLVAFTKNNFVDGTRMIPSSGLELSLYIAEADDQGNWSNPVPYPYNGSGYSTGFPAFSKDGNSLYFASDRPDGFGGYDIYVSYRVGNSWSAPENLGAAVNTQGNEITPFHDGDYLFFSSDWHKGFGGFDIFRAGQSNGRWNQITHGGTGLNSSRDDYGYVFDNFNNVGYIVSNRLGGKGYEDIYRTKVMGGGISSGGGDVNTGSLSIKVMNAATQRAIPNAEIDLNGCGKGVVYTNVEGRYFLKVDENYDCSAVIIKPGYLSKTIILNTLTLGRSGNLEVYLSREGETYSGQIVDRVNGQLLDNVLVRATDTETRQSLESYSNSEGKYLLPLKSSTLYNFKFSRVGYKETTLNLRTGPEGTSKIFEVIQLLPSNVVLTDDPVEGDFNEDDRNNSNSGSGGNTKLRSGYAVQVASVGANKSVNLGEYQSSLEDFGEVFEYLQDGRKKIRVGTFDSRSEAEDVKRSVRSKGYSGAFIVNQPSITIDRPGRNSGNNGGFDDRDRENERDDIGLNEDNMLDNSDGDSGYMVQIAAFKNPDNFDKESVFDIGIVKQYPKGAVTAIVLAGYDSRDQAERAKNRARSRGFKGAYLVRLDNGRLVKAE